MRISALWLAIVACVAVGCFRASDERNDGITLGSEDGGSDGGTDAGAGGGSGQSTDLFTADEVANFDAALAQCAITESGHRDITTPAAVTQALTGIWAACRGGLLPALPNEVGLEFRANGRWHRLTRDAAGIHRLDTFEGGGSWSAPYDTIQVNIVLNAGGTVIVMPSFSATPNKVYMTNNGVYDGVWAAAP